MHESPAHSYTHCLPCLLAHRAAAAVARSTWLKFFQLVLWPLESQCKEIITNISWHWEWNAKGKIYMPPLIILNTFNVQLNTLSLLNRLCSLFALIHINFLPLEHTFCRGRDHVKNSSRVCIGGYQNPDDIFDQECSAKMVGHQLRPCQFQSCPCPPSLQAFDRL